MVVASAQAHRQARPEHPRKGQVAEMATMPGSHTGAVVVAVRGLLAPRQAALLAAAHPTVVRVLRLASPGQASAGLAAAAAVPRLHPHRRAVVVRAAVVLVRQGQRWAWLVQSTPAAAAAAGLARMATVQQEQADQAS